MRERPTCDPLRYGDRHANLRGRLAGSSGATIIIFVPLAFLGGVTGAFFQALALTMASALTISFVIAWLAVPLLAERLVVEHDLRSDADDWMARTVHPRYRNTMSALSARSRRVRWTSVASASRRRCQPAARVNWSSHSTRPASRAASSSYTR